MSCQLCRKPVSEDREGLVTIFYPAYVDEDSEYLTEEEMDNVVRGFRDVCHECYEGICDYNHAEQLNLWDRGLDDPWIYSIDY